VHQGAGVGVSLASGVLSVVTVGSNASTGGVGVLDGSVAGSNAARTTVLVGIPPSRMIGTTLFSPMLSAPSTVMCFLMLA
jgi:hypothetical protein